MKKLYYNKDIMSEESEDLVQNFDQTHVINTFRRIGNNKLNTWNIPKEQKIIIIGLTSQDRSTTEKSFK